MEESIKLGELLIQFGIFVVALLALIFQVVVYMIGKTK